MNRNQRRLRLHKKRKAAEMFWNIQADPMPILPKGRVKSKGRAMGREFRNMDYAPGQMITVETTDALGTLNSTGTRVLGQKFTERHTGRTWLRRSL